MAVELAKFVFYSAIIVIISKYILVSAIRNLAKNINMSAKLIGDIAGFTTSMPELLTITASSIKGLYSASLYNILSSNIINLVQYLATVLLNKNAKKLRNKAIVIDIILVIVTILIPILLLNFHIVLTMSIVPLFIILYIFFIYLNNNAHKMYLRKVEEDSIENKYERKNIKKISINIIILLVSGILLFIVGELLGQTLENLCRSFNISEIIIGCLLGVITSIPEFITFFESQKHHKKMSDDMVGVIEATNNLLTSNILNLFLIQTIGILIINF